MSRQKKYRLIIGLCAAGIIIYLIVKIISAFIDNAKAFEEDLPPVYSLTTEDSSLIAPKYRGQIKVDKVLKSKVRNPISLISYNGKYNLILYKVGQGINMPLEKIIALEEKSVDRSTEHTYSVIDNNFYLFLYTSGVHFIDGTIYLNWDVDTLSTIQKSDSIIGYHLLCNNLSISYLKDGPIDLFLEADKKAFTNVKVPIDILFLQRNSVIYFLLMTPSDRAISIPSSLLYNLVTGK